MSYYLIQQIEDDRRTSTVRTCTEVIEAHGDDHLESLTLRDNATGETETVDAAAAVRVHRRGAADRLAGRRGGAGQPRFRGRRARPGRSTASGRAGWELDRTPYHLETSVPGVFVAGDARAESAKRVASAVGEGAMAVMLVHRYLEKR